MQKTVFHIFITGCLLYTTPLLKAQEVDDIAIPEIDEIEDSDILGELDGIMEELDESDTVSTDGLETNAKESNADVKIQIEDTQLNEGSNASEETTETLLENNDIEINELDELELDDTVPLTDDAEKDKIEITKDIEEQYKRLKAHLLNFINPPTEAQTDSMLNNDMLGDEIVLDDEIMLDDEVSVGAEVEGLVEEETELTIKEQGETGEEGAVDDILSDSLGGTFETQETDSMSEHAAKSEEVETVDSELPDASLPDAPLEVTKEQAKKKITETESSSQVVESPEIKESKEQEDTTTAYVVPSADDDVEEETDEKAVTKKKGKLSEEEKAYMMSLESQKSDLATNRRLAAGTQNTLDHVTGDLIANRRGAGEKKEIAIRRGIVSDEGKKLNGEIKSTAGIDLTVKDSSMQIETIEIHLEKAYRALISGQIEAATNIYKIVLDQEYDNKEAMFGLATAYHKNGQHDQAKQIYSEILEAYPNHTDALNNFLVLAAKEAPEDALIELMKIEKIRPDFSPVPAQIAMIYLKLDKPEKAERFLKRAIRLSPDNVSYIYNLAIVSDNLGKNNQAKNLYKRVLQAVKNGAIVPGSINTINDRIKYLEKSS